ncbi:STAS domain-containing protein [Jeotgalibacillus sp. S-D1]|uniref:STAS domain-containing protein n=1 Tax=Jeotgalibacillus sp. S-D1 TaxID=2552189 RepID=UPI001059FDCA|nr:STAS domain-containing protein [Jeotgalibacillus sp. S-D1]TDL31415.1 STAS domain-containing protein [Jeotgalibacillus sp. S-D1]
MDVKELIGSAIIESSFSLAEKMNEGIDKGFVKSIFSEEDVIELNQWRAEFINYLGEAIKAGSNEGVWEKAAQWAKTSGETAVARDVALNDAITTLTSWRVVTWEAVAEKIDELELSARNMLDISFIIDPLIDHAAQIFCVEYVENYRQHISKAQNTVIEYSVPVVGLSDDVAILPLIGELDDERAKILKEVALHKCLELRISTLIFDLSGVPMVDTMVANELSQVIDSLKLIGVKTVLTGLRPEIAQAVVEIGIKFEGMTIKKNLKSAIEELQNTSNL